MSVEKTDFNVFLNPIVKQLKELEYGIDITTNDCIKPIRFYLLTGVFDKPAKAAILNIVQWNGEYGCSRCLQPGISYKTSAGLKAYS